MLTHFLSKAFIYEPILLDLLHVGSYDLLNGNNNAFNLLDDSCVPGTLGIILYSPKVQELCLFTLAFLSDEKIPTIY